MKSLPINQYFYSWQGEGCHTGRPAFFIRLQGCPVKCPWCDSLSTWHPEYLPPAVDKKQASELVALAIRHKPDFVVLTGGEPTIYDLSELTALLRAKDLAVHLETCGAFEIKGQFDWITVSPKWNRLPLHQNLAIANEIKLIVDAADAVDRWQQQLGEHLRGKTVWLNPEWGVHRQPEILAAINRAVKQADFAYRAGFQLHKIYQVDEEDQRSRSKPAVFQDAIGSTK